MSNENPLPDKSSKQLTPSLRALDMLCLFLAPLAGGAGNYMALFFSSSLHWSTNKIGVLLAIMSISIGIAQIPAGVFIDKTSHLKRIIMIALSLLTLAWLTILVYPDFYTAMVAQVLIGMTCAIFMPAVASMTLGLVGFKKFDVRLGRNGVFSHAGNALTAVIIAFCLAKSGSWSVLVLFIVFACLAIIATSRINRDCIDYIYLHKHTENHKGVHPLLGGFASLLKSRTSVFFTIAALLYTFADASMLPLMVQRIASTGSKSSNVHVPIALFLTELVMIPVCYIAAKRAHLGRKPLLVISYAFLFIRGVSFSLTSDPNMLVGLQILDGISAGIFGLMLTLVISDLSVDTGRFNATLTTMGMFFTLTNGVSNLIFGFTTGKFGYPMAFTIMAICAALGGVLIWTLVPETIKKSLIAVPDMGV
jgi:MFS family permease